MQVNHLCHERGDLFAYEADRCRQQFASFVIQEGLPFNHFDNRRLTNVIQKCLQPRYTQVSRATLRRDALKMWKKAKHELINGFENLNTNVNLTADVWSAPHGLPGSYLCVTAHWVDPATWQMMKRTIDFKKFEYPHTGVNLFYTQERIQHISNLDGDCLEIEKQLLDVEAEAGYTISLSDEEIALDEQARSWMVLFILNGVLDWRKRKKKKRCFFKVDFAKAYDRFVGFIADVLGAFWISVRLGVLGLEVMESIVVLFKGASMLEKNFLDCGDKVLASMVHGDRLDFISRKVSYGVRFEEVQVLKSSGFTRGFASCLPLVGDRFPALAFVLRMGRVVLFYSSSGFS
ncbi:hypothetical protein Tco_0511903 [Tanacetum coccineum]